MNNQAHCNKHHNNYKLMFYRSLDQIKQLKRMYQEEKLRADQLQADLDKIDDFYELTESELARSVRSNSVN